MSAFFKGWKKKIGVLTLVMACLAMAGWMRSLAVQDQICFRSRKHTMEFLQSFKNSISWHHFYNDSEAGPLLLSKCYNKWDAFPRFTDIRMSGDSDYFGFVMRTFSSNQANGYLLQIPYWSLVLPLTALAAYLLLKKPKTSTQKKTAHPTANEGATT